MELLENGFDVHIVVDACSSRYNCFLFQLLTILKLITIISKLKLIRSMVDRMYSFERMKAAGAWLTTSESVILGLVGSSSHPKFKEVQKVILESAPDSGLLGRN